MQAKGKIKEDEKMLKVIPVNISCKKVKSNIIFFNSTVMELGGPRAQARHFFQGNIVRKSVCHFNNFW